ncbi:succinylglutamate desuccinylase/aspartoacylase family protein [Aminobacter aganoensis]|uniref:Succinylglutamate desuccinylase/Aspartoacylase catalytic domain-containing protein n=1 Tax=Aminobacter aganoensis TaxID=83264 RepID=A0A7X0KNH2_9HYPH|nr:succinylglutamate desuccinylase/aspartoacylase family protein [Aminobacter aganoensis]MBB6357089.1 hypothetical protein [Aminobacter aganoensis]
MTLQSRIWTPVDFDADGSQSDCFRLPHSTDLSAYGWIPIPVFCLKNGPGPTALLISGTHGDEYEGQVALLNLARSLDCADIRGRVIIVPALNYPAVISGRRVSPLDEGNLNRMFPGNALGTPSQMIAHYVSEVLIPMANFVVDLHSGGRSLHYVQSSLVRPGRDEGQRQALFQMMEVFGAPISFVSNGAGGGGMTTLASAAEERNILALTTELGGGATLSSAGAALAENGLKRLLKHFGVTPELLVEPAQPTRIMMVAGRDSFVYSHSRGIFEPFAELGDEVRADDEAGLIHPVEWPYREPQLVRFASSGLVACRRAPSLAEPGDCLFKLMVPLEQL